MSKLMDLMNIHLGIKSNDVTIYESTITRFNWIKKFIKDYNLSMGYRGKGMCRKCSMMVPQDGLLFCVDKMKSCQSANITCKGTK